MPPKQAKKAQEAKADQATDSKAGDGTAAAAGSDKKTATNSKKRTKAEYEDDKPEPRRSARPASKPSNDNKSDEAATKQPPKKRANREETATKTKSSANSKTNQADDKKASRPPPGKRASQPEEDKHGPVGSKDRLPKVGQTVFWRAMPGMVEGKVLEILKSDTTVGGKSVKASEDSPQLRLESTKSGKECVHKIDNTYFKDA